MHNLKRIRTQRGLRQVDIALFLEIDRTTYVKYETGASEPDFETLKRLAEYFETTTSYLIGETDDPTPLNAKRPVYDDEAWEMMREMHERPELRALFKTTKNVSRQDIEAVDNLLKRMAGGSKDDI